MEYFTNLAMMMVAWVTVLLVIVQVITEVVKTVFDVQDAKVMKILAFVISESVSVIAMCLYYLNSGYDFKLYYIGCFLLVGCCVSYSAQLGYDKFVSLIFEALKRLANRDGE